MLHAWKHALKQGYNSLFFHFVFMYVLLSQCGDVNGRIIEKLTFWLIYNVINVLAYLQF